MKKLISILLLGLAVSPSLLADTSTGAAVKNLGDDASNSAAKSTRAVKRKTRKATGNDTAAKDARDKAQDVGGDVGTRTKKASRDVTSG